MARVESGFNVRWTFLAFSTALAVLLLATVGILVMHQAVQARQKTHEQQRASERLAKYAPLTAEELAVYRAVLTLEFKGQTICRQDGNGCLYIGHIYQPDSATLSVLIDKLNDLDSGECLKKLRLENDPHIGFRRLSAVDLFQMGFGNLHLVEPEQQVKEIVANNPDDAQREGRKIDAAASAKAVHGMLSLSEIRFDKSQTHAIVSFGYFCGRLCGNGETLLMEKKNGVWIRKSECGGWIS